MTSKDHQPGGGHAKADVVEQADGQPPDDARIVPEPEIVVQEVEDQKPQVEESADGGVHGVAPEGCGVKGDSGGHLADLAHRPENRLDAFAEEVAAEDVDDPLFALGMAFEEFGEAEVLGVEGVHHFAHRLHAVH